MLTSVLVPGSMAISGTTFTTDLVWDTPTAELLRLNEQKLREMGLSDKVVRAMTRNPWLLSERIDHVRDGARAAAGGHGA